MMKKEFIGSVVAVVVALGALFASAGSWADGHGDAAAGEAKTAICAGCHGADGNSALADFPKLAGQGQKYLFEELLAIQSKQRDILEMTGMLDGMSEQDLKDIAAFYESKEGSVGQANKDLVARGEQLYRSGNPALEVAACTACHGPTGAGIALAGFPALSGQHAAYTEKQLYDFRTGKRVSDGDTRVMRSIAARLSDKDIEALANYIQGLY